MKMIWAGLKYLIVVIGGIVFFTFFFGGVSFIFPSIEFHTPQMNISLVEEALSDEQNWSYSHNLKKNDKQRVWKIVYLDAGAYFESSLSYQQVSIPRENEISIIEKSSDRSIVEGFLVGYEFDGAMLYYLNKRDFLQKEIVGIKGPVLGGDWLENEVLLLAMNDNFTLDAYWYVYQNEDWSLVRVIETDIHPKEYIETIALSKTGIFALVGDNVYLFSLNNSTYEKVLSDVELYNILGSSAFYIMHYRDAEGSVFDAVTDETKIITWRENIFPEFDAFSNEEDVTLYRVSLSDKKFHVRKKDKIYELLLP